MGNNNDCRLNALVIGILLLTTSAIAPLCSGSKLTKANSEVLDGELVGIIVLQAEPSAGELGPGPYLLCSGKTRVLNQLKEY